MDIIDRIKKCKNDEQIKALADKYIKKKTREAKECNEDTSVIGFDVEINPYCGILDDNHSHVNQYLDGWVNYIPKDTKIVYGGYYYNLYDYMHIFTGGLYYYVDDESYVYEFFKYIKDLKIEYDYDVFVAVHDFINKKFGEPESDARRHEMFQLILKEDGLNYYRPIKEHSIKDFYGTNSAMCSERAVIAENLLSLLDFDIIFFHDDNHAFNFIIKNYDDEEQFELYVLDFSMTVPCYDINHNYIKNEPYYMKVENMDNEAFCEFLNGSEPIEVPNYLNYYIGDEVKPVQLTDNRTYGKRKFRHDIIGLSNVQNQTEKKIVLERMKR